VEAGKVGLGGFSKTPFHFHGYGSYKPTCSLFSVQLRTCFHVFLANLHAGLETHITMENAPEKDLWI